MEPNANRPPDRPIGGVTGNTTGEPLPTRCFRCKEIDACSGRIEPCERRTEPLNVPPNCKSPPFGGEAAPLTLSFAASALVARVDRDESTAKRFPGFTLRPRIEFISDGKMPAPTSALPSDPVNRAGGQLEPSFGACSDGGVTDGGSGVAAAGVCRCGAAGRLRTALRAQMARCGWASVVRADSERFVDDLRKTSSPGEVRLS